jgi:hypothetical protein
MCYPAAQWLAGEFCTAGAKFPNFYTIKCLGVAR